MNDEKKTFFLKIVLEDMEDVTQRPEKKMLKVKLCDFIGCEKFRFDGKHIKNTSYKESFFLFHFELPDQQNIKK